MYAEHGCSCVCSHFAMQEGEFAPACRDVNAPDLYIPVMSFVTFILLAGLLKGTLGEYVPAAHPHVPQASSPHESLTGAFYPTYDNMLHATACIVLVSFSFTPEALSEVMSRSIVAEVLEVGVIYGVFAMQKVSHELSLLSLVAYSGYKYFGYVNAIDWVFRARQ